MNIGWAVEQAKAGGKPRLPDWPPGAYAAIFEGLFIQVNGHEGTVHNEGYVRGDWERLVDPPETFDFWEAWKRHTSGKTVGYTIGDRVLWLIRDGYGTLFVKNVNGMCHPLKDIHLRRTDWMEVKP